MTPPADTPPVDAPRIGPDSSGEPDQSPDRKAIARVFREESARTIAGLVRRFGDIDLAEDAVQEAFAIAVRRWPMDGVPPAPGAWIATTARNRAIDRLRRESKRDRRHEAATRLAEQTATTAEEIAHTMIDGDERIDDDRLRLTFTCCHPALSREAQVALTLRLISGLSTDDIARAFLVEPRTMAQRLTRAKRRIKVNAIPYRIPSASELPNRLPSVLAVIYLIFNEGYLSRSGDSLGRPALSAEAIRLGRLLMELMPDEAEVMGLVALMLLTDARAPARTDSEGRIVRLAAQDRSLWDRHRMADGLRLVDRCLRQGALGTYQVQAAIAAVHAGASTFTETDWPRIVELYDLLLRMTPTPVVALNRAIAIAEVDGPERALALVDQLKLPAYALFHATRGDLLDRMGRAREAAEAFTVAATQSANEVERAHLADRARAVERRSEA